MKNHFLVLYTAAFDNANELLSEAELLYEREKYPRAYALAFTALEEIAKSQLAADVFTGLIEENEFRSQYRDHRWKIRNMVWASEDAKHYLDAEEEAYIAIEKPTFDKRMNALYTEINGKTVQVPGDLFTREDAQSIIHTVRVAIQRILEVTEYFGHQIGTKGFMK